MTRVVLCSRMYGSTGQAPAPVRRSPGLQLKDDKVTARALWLGVGLWGLADGVSRSGSGREAVARRVQKMSRRL